MKLGTAEERFNANMKSCFQMGDYNSIRVPIEGKAPKLYGGVQLSDRNFNKEQPGSPKLSQTGFDGYHGIK